MNPITVFLGYCAIGILYLAIEPVVIGTLYRANWDRHSNVRSTGTRMRLADEDSEAQGRIVCGLAAVMLAIGWTIVVFRIGG